MSATIEAEKIYTELGSIRAELETIKAQLAQLQTAEPIAHPHIVRSPQLHRGEATIRGSAITVRTVVERIRLGDTVEQIVEAYPVLTLAQVYDALGYYYDQPGEIDAHLQANREALWRLRNRASS